METSVLSQEELREIGLVGVKLPSQVTRIKYKISQPSRSRKGKRGKATRRVIVIETAEALPAQTLTARRAGD